MPDVNAQAPAWDRFLSEGWGKALTVLPVAAAPGSPLLEDGLAALHKVLTGGQYKMSVDGQPVAKALIPQEEIHCRSAEELVALLDRLKALHGGEAVTVSAHNLQAHSAALYFKARTFLKPLIDALGLPGGGINTFAISGMYRETSVGIHCDPCDIFLFPLHGTKTIYGWETDKFIGTVEDLQAFEADGAVLKGEPFEPHLGDATCVHAQPGEVIYIPARYWHINVLEQAQSSLAVGFSLFSNRSAGEIVLPVLNRAVKAPAHAMAFKSFPRPAVAIGDSVKTVALPEGAESFLHQVRQAMSLNLMQRSSGSGFLTGTPRRADAGRSLSGTWRLRDRLSAIHTLRDPIDPDTKIYVAANGSLGKVNRHEAMEAAIHRLNAGDPVSVNSEQLHAGAADLKDLIGFLHSCDAVVEVASESEKSIA